MFRYLMIRRVDAPGQYERGGYGGGGAAASRPAAIVIGGGAGLNQRSSGGRSGNPAQDAISAHERQMVAAMEVPGTPQPLHGPRSCYQSSPPGRARPASCACLARLEPCAFLPLPESRLSERESPGWRPNYALSSSVPCMISYCP